MSLLGAVRVERAYYHCRRCRAGHCPHDALLRLGDGGLTAGAREAACLAGTLGSFAEAAEKVLPKLAGLRLAESTVERAAEAAGADVGARLRRGETFGPDAPFSPTRKTPTRPPGEDSPRMGREGLWWALPSPLLVRGDSAAP